MPIFIYGVIGSKKDTKNLKNVHRKDAKDAKKKYLDATRKKLPDIREAEKNLCALCSFAMRK